ncbi:uncharacterized protein [Blastocystis hominis]|uniref:Uncharacterized protein n=1 Tax=Blastocystis hominis TaxID=12968 RepID=D8M5H6_BLAHO|nr:uncharacterized protein [Blastocystis hominis]CBK23315.2 unnamed protein product [Blastocystis hominis]|eukprot:XP_012897363.1 uncharacterized protein [Blastocystis hominis]
MNQCFDSAALDIRWKAETDGYYIHADYVFSLSGNLGTIVPASGSQSHTWRIPFDDGVYYANYGPMVAEYPVDITNGLSNIQLYCNIVKSKTIPRSLRMSRWIACTRITSTRIACCYHVLNCLIASCTN